MTYRADHVTQKDGSVNQWNNCRMAAGATMLDFHTEGSKTSTGAKMRERQTDHAGGTDAYDLQRAWQSYDERLVIRNGKYWADLVNDRKKGWFVSLDVWYAELPDRCQQSGNIGHTIGVAPETLDNGRWLVSDPLCSGYKWMVPGDLQRAAQAWGKRNGIGTAIMYTTAQEAGVQKVETINTSGFITSTKLAQVKTNAPWYYNDECTEQAATFSAAAKIPYVGATKRSTRAVIVNTGRPYDDKEPRLTIVYMKPADVVLVDAPKPAPCPDCPDCPGEADIIAARDDEWVAHLTPPRITTP